MINPYLNEKIPLEERNYQNNLYKEKFLCMKKNSIIILKDSECSQFKEYFLEKMGFHSFQNAKESLKIQKKIASDRCNETRRCNLSRLSLVHY